jgi:hypothetical protein
MTSQLETPTISERAVHNGFARMTVVAGGWDLLLRWQAPVWTRLWHEDFRLTRHLTRYVCLCLHDKTGVIAQRARLLLVFHGLLLAGVETNSRYAF